MRRFHFLAWNALGSALFAGVLVGLGHLFSRQLEQVPALASRSALRESERKFQTMARISPAIIFQADAVGRIIYVNDQWRQLTGRSADAALGEGWVRAVFENDRERIAAEWRQSVQQGAPWKSEFRIQTDEGNVVWMLGQAAVERGDRDQVVGFVGTFTDITEIKRAGQLELENAYLQEKVIAPVPHRHYVLALPKMLRPYFQRHRSLLKHLCALAHQSLTEYLRAALDLPDAHPALILTLHTFGEYLDFHPHIHALVADGLFTRDLSACGHAQAGGTFHPLPPLPLKPLEELFRAHVLKLLVALKLLPPERVQVLLSWKHSGFNLHAGDPVPPENKAELEQLAHYILRNPFSVEKPEFGS